MTDLTFGSAVPVMVTAPLALAWLIVWTLDPMTPSLPSGAAQAATGPATPGLSNSARMVIATIGAPRPAATTVAAFEIAPGAFAKSAGASPKRLAVQGLDP